MNIGYVLETASRGLGDTGWKRETGFPTNSSSFKHLGLGKDEGRFGLLKFEMSVGAPRKGMINYSISVKGKARLLSAERGGRSVSRFGHWGERKKRLLCAVEKACWRNVPGM